MMAMLMVTIQPKAILRELMLEEATMRIATSMLAKD